MRTLYLMRHAKSDWDDRDLDDHARVLSPRGRRAAPLVAEHMKAHGMVPSLVLSSDSERTRETWSLVGPVLAPDAEVEFSRSLYLAAAGTLLDAVQAVPSGTGSALVLAHNPGMHVLANLLAGDGDPIALQHLASKYPTAAVAEIRFDTDRWSEVEPGRGALVRFVRPRELE